MPEFLPTQHWPIWGLLKLIETFVARPRAFIGMGPQSLLLVFYNPLIYSRSKVITGWEIIVTNKAPFQVALTEYSFPRIPEDQNTETVSIAFKELRAERQVRTENYFLLRFLRSLMAARKFVKNHISVKTYKQCAVTVISTQIRHTCIQSPRPLLACSNLWDVQTALALFINKPYAKMEMGSALITIQGYSFSSCRNMK